MKTKEELEHLLSDHPIVDKARIQITTSENGISALNVTILAKSNQFRSNYMIQEFLEKQFEGDVIFNNISWASTLEELNEQALENNISSVPSVKLNNATEAYVFEIWKEVLGSDDFTVNDTFFEVGGDSLKCVQVLFHLNLKHSEITLTDLFTFTSIKELADYIDELDGGKAPAEVTIHAAKF